MFASQALGGGAEAYVEDWGLMKGSTTAACCVCLPFRPAARTSEMERGQRGGGGHTTRLKQKQASAVSTFSDFISLKTFEEILKPLTQSVGQTCNFPATNNNRTGSMKDYQK